MMKYSEIAEQTGTTIEDVRDAMRCAHQHDVPYEHIDPRTDVMTISYRTMWTVGNDGTGVIGTGKTREEAVIYALEHNLQFVKVL